MKRRRKNCKVGNEKNGNGYRCKNAKKGKMSPEEIAEYVPSLFLEELKEFEDEIMQTA